MANTKVSGDLIQDGAISQNHLNENHGITTTDISEGTALYYTDARVLNYLTTNNYATQAYVGTITTNSTNWDTAYSWGDHSLVGYLTTETDPVFVASPAYGITSTNITNWNTAYGWGDHSAAGYLTSFTETDPIYVASSWYTTTNNATNWDTAYSWGDHAAQSYATQTYVNTAVANLVDTAPTTLDTLNELAAALGDDPNFATTVSTSIGTKWTQDNTKISNWDTAYSWGNHASAGYLTSFDITTQTDPKYLRSDTSDTMTGNLTVTGTSHLFGGYSEPSGIDFEIASDNYVNFYQYAYNNAYSYISTTYNSFGIQYRPSNGVTNGLTNTVIDYVTPTADANTAYTTLNINNSQVLKLTKTDVLFSVDAKAPVFYDSDNTTYFVNPNSSTTSANFAGKVQASTVGVTNIVTNKVVKFNGTILDDSIITDDGTNVGIGANSPSTRLHINEENAKSILTISRGGTNLAAETDLGSIKFDADYDGSYTPYAEIKAYANALSGVRSSLDFSVKSTSGSILTGMTVYGTSSGVNIGIGTTSPDDKLQIDAPNSQLRLRDTDDGTYTQFSSSGNLLAIRQNSTSASHFWLNSSGNVGIGTSSPSGILHLYSDAPVLAATSTNNSSGLRFNVTGTAQTAFRFQYNGTTLATINSSGLFDVGTNSITAGSITVGGYLLENSSDRDGLLEINQKGTTGWTGVQIVNGQRWSLMGNNANVGIYNDSTNEWVMLCDTNAGVTLYYNNAEQLKAENGYAKAANQMRAPIYYDLNNTAYYVDPASTSNLNALTANGTVLANQGVYVPYAAGQHKPMIVLNGATDYGLFHTEASNDEFTFDFAGTQTFKFRQDGVATFNGGTVWTSNNFSSTNISNWNTAYGWGNHAAQSYIVAGSSIASQATWSNATRFNSTGNLEQAAGNHSLQVYAANGNDAFMAFHISADYAVHFGLDKDSNRMSVGGWSDGTGTRYQLWDSRDFSLTNVSNWNTAYGWGNHASAGYLTSLPSHTHDDRYLVKGGSWNGANMPGSRWGGFSANGGEVVFQQDNPNTGQMSVMVDGNFYAGENNGFWSLYSSNSYNSKAGMYANVNGYLILESPSRVKVKNGSNSQMNINFDQIWTDSGNLHLQYSGSGNIDMNQGGGYAFSRTSLRAPVFYDSNNTGYYVDPNSNSKAVTFHLGNGSTFNAGSTYALQLSHNNRHLLALNYNNSANYPWLVNDTWNGGAALIVHFNGVGDRFFVNSGGHMQADGSSRAPIFYDSNDTGYFIDPNSTSRINSLYLVGGVGGISNSSSYTEAAIEVRERGFGGAQDDTWATAPRIGFHWGGRVASQIALSSNGWINILNNPANGYESFRAGAIYSTGDVTAYYSDIRLKDIQGPIENAIESVKSIETFKYKNNDIAKQNGFVDDDVHVGVSAQSVEAVLPEIVKHAPFDIESKDGKTISKTGEWYKTVQYEKLVPLLIEAIKEQQQQIEELKQLINK